MNKKKRIRNIILISLVVVILGLLVCSNLMKSRKKAPEVNVAALKSRDIISTVSATGELRATNQVDISAEIVAKVRRLYVKEGDRVRKGQLLCVLDDVSSRSNRDLNKANYDQAKLAYDRGKALYVDSLISSAEFERLRTAFEVARAHLDQSQDNLSKTRIYAPISGRVVRLNVEQGETVMMGTMNNAGTVIITIADLSDMQARVDVDESDVVNLRVGQSAKIKLDAMPDTFFKAKVSTVGYMPNSSMASAAEGVTDFEVLIDLVDTDPAQRPGMSVTADIITAERKNVVVCPLQAIGRRKINEDEESRETVFVVKKDNTVKLTAVETGISDGRSVEIVSGLKKGNMIVTGPYKILRTLSDGDEVKPLKGEDGWRKKGQGARVEVKIGG